MKRCELGANDHNFLIWPYWLTTEDSNPVTWEPDLGARAVASIAITKHVTASQCNQTQSKTNGELANHAGSMFLVFSWQWYRCECCHGSSPRILTNGWTNYKTTPETLANGHRSLGMRLRQDYTHCVMLNDCVSSCWSPMCRYPAFTLLRNSHPLATRHSRELVRH